MPNKDKVNIEVEYQLRAESEILLKEIRQINNEIKKSSGSYNKDISALVEKANVAKKSVTETSNALSKVKREFSESYSNVLKNLSAQESKLASIQKATEGAKNSYAKLVKAKQSGKNVSDKEYQDALKAQRAAVLYENSYGKALKSKIAASKVQLADLEAGGQQYAPIETTSAYKILNDQAQEYLERLRQMKSQAEQISEALKTPIGADTAKETQDNVDNLHKEVEILDYAAQLEKEQLTYLESLTEEERKALEVEEAEAEAMKAKIDALGSAQMYVKQLAKAQESMAIVSQDPQSSFFLENIPITTSQIEALNAKLDEIATTMMELDAISQQIGEDGLVSDEVALKSSELEAKINQLSSEYIQLSEGIMSANTANAELAEETNNVSLEFDTESASMSEISAKLAELKAQQKAWDKSGEFKLGDEQYNRLLVLMRELEQEQRAYKQELLGTAPVEKEHSTNLKDIARDTNKTTRSTKSFSKSLSQLKKSAKRGLTFITKYFLGFRSLFFLVRRLRSGIKEGIENLYNYNRSNNQTHTALDQLATSLLYIKNAWGAAFAPIINAVMPMLTSFIDTLADAGNKLAMFFAQLTGATTVIQAVKTFKAYNDELDKNAAGSSKAGKAADKLKDKLAPFDDLNVLGKDDHTDTTGSGSGGSGNLTEADYSKMFETVEVAKNSFVETLKSGDLFEIGSLIGNSIKDSLESIDWDSIQENIRTKLINLVAFINGVLNTPDLFKDVGSTLAELLNTVVISLDTILTEFDFAQLGRDVVDLVLGFIKTTDFGIIGKTIVDAVIGTFNLGKGLLEGLSSEDLPRLLWEKIKELFSKIDWGGLMDAALDFTFAAASFVNKFVDDLYKLLFDVTAPVAEFFANEIEASGGDIAAGLLKGIWDGLYNIGVWLKEHIYDPIVNKIKELFGIHSPSKVMAEIGGFIIQGLLNGLTSLKDKVAEVWRNFKNTAVEIFYALRDSISDIWTRIRDNIVSKVTNIRDGVVNIFGGLKNSIRDKFGAIRDSVAGWIQEIKVNINKKFRDLVDSAVYVFSLISQPIVSIFEKLNDALKKPLNFIIGLIESFCNFIITGVNGLVDLLNKISIKIDPSVREFAKNFNITLPGSIGFNIDHLDPIQIKPLATGAVIPPNNEFLALLGDQKQGTNIEAPLDTIVDAFKQVVGNLNVQNTGNAVMQVDGQTFARLMTPYVVSELGRRGYNVNILEV